MRLLSFEAFKLPDHHGADEVSIRTAIWELPASFVLGWLGVIAALGVAYWLWWMPHAPVYNRDPKRAEMCMDWRVESFVEKHLDGPYVMNDCEEYFQHRSASDAEEDNAYWQKKIADAQNDWQEYQAKNHK
jgi:hypothetical protein